jgi:cytochrome c553
MASTARAIAMLAAAIVSVTGCANTRNDTPLSVDARAGRALAGDLCAGCHAIDRAGNSANPAAPPFRSILSRLSSTELQQKLSTGALMGHPELPTVHLSAQGAKELVAWLEAIREP